MAKQREETKPGGGEVLKTEGEASARAYAEAAVPGATLCPTVEMDKVRLLPPTQTPTTRLGDLAKRAGPRAPDETTKPAPKPLVDLPEGRPVTEMQVIEIDPELLLELARRQNEREAPGAPASGTEPLAARTESPWVQETGAPTAAAEETPATKTPPATATTQATKHPARRAAITAAVLGVAVVVAVLAATHAPRPTEERKRTATAKASTTATVTRTVVTATPSTTAMPAATATPSTTASAPAAPRVETPAPIARARAAATQRDPYDDAAVPSASAAPAPAAVPPPAKTATTAPTASPRAGTLPEF
jgi:hypothetical protein